MNALFHSPAGGEAQRVHSGQVLDLTVPVVADGVTVFRRTLYLRVPLDAACDRLSVAPGSALALRFEPCTVTVGATDHAWVRRWAGAFGTVQVELAYPAPVTRVDSELYGAVGLHRVDGEAVSDEPTVSGTPGATLPEPLVATAFEARLSGQKPAVRARRKGEAIARRQAGHKSLSAAAVVGQGVAIQDYAIQDDAIQEVELLVERLGGLTALHLAGAPGSPRLTLRSADGTEVLWQWIEPGPHDAAVDFAPLDLAAHWQAALERALVLASQPGPRPPVLVLALEVASDAPCRVRLPQAQVEVLLERPLLTAPTVLRFAGTAAETRTLTLAAPAHGQRLDVLGRVGGGGSAGGNDNDTLPAHGLYLETGHSARAGVTRSAPLRSTGLGIGWHALDGATALEVSLHRPGQATHALASAVVELDSPHAGTVYARWPALDLQAGDCQVRVAVRSGAGVWAGTPDAQATAEVDAGAGSVTTAAWAPALHWLTPGQDDTAPATFALNGAPLPAAPLPADAPAPPKGALALSLAPLPPALAGGGPWTLAASAAQALTLTVDAVRVAYRPD